MVLAILSPISGMFDPATLTMNHRSLELVQILFMISAATLDVWRKRLLSHTTTGKRLD